MPKKMSTHSKQISVDFLSNDLLYSTIKDKVAKQTTKNTPKNNALMSKGGFQFGTTAMPSP